MEQQVLSLLKATLKSNTNSIREAEQALLGTYSDPQFPFALIAIANQDSIDIASRKSSLTTLKNYVSATWSPQLDETFLGQVYLDENAKGLVRNQVFGLAAHSGGPGTAELQPLAASVVGKIASVDFPDQWPDLFPSLLTILNTVSHDATVKGALKVIYELIDSGFTEDQFFTVARDLVNAFHHVATGSQCGLNVRAFALHVFQSSFDMLEMVMGDHGPAVKAFLDESLKDWMTFFTTLLQEPLPPASIDVADKDDPRRGLVTFKVQAVKTIDKLRRVYAAGISPYVQSLFQITWHELARIVPEYGALFIDGDEDGKLADESDGLPYSLDALVVEELDFLQMALKAPPVRKELTQQLQQQGSPENGFGWVQSLLDLLAQFSRPSNEEQGMWDIDIDLYLGDMDSITTNYTPRTACAEVISQTLFSWLKQTLLEAMLFFAEARTQSGRNVSWKEHEAYLYLLTQALKEADDEDIVVDPAVLNRLLIQISGLSQNSSPYVRAGAQLTLASFFKIAGRDFHPAGANALTGLINAATNDDSDIVQVACFSAFAAYIDALPTEVIRPLQSSVFDAVANFIASHDLKDELEEADEVKGALVTTLHEAMMINNSTIMDTSALDTYLSLASEASSSPLLSTQLIDSFETLTSAIASLGPPPYAILCSKTVPSLTAAFDIGSLTSEDSLTTLAADLLSVLAEHAPPPLPTTFLTSALPKLHRILMHSTVDTLVRPATTALQHLLLKGTTDFLAYTDQSGTPSLELTLTIINRLLTAPELDESACCEVGALASSVVEKFGPDKLGPYLMELLRAVATRLASAEKIGFIQSLCMVFVSLAMSGAADVVEFLDQVTIPIPAGAGKSNQGATNGNTGSSNNGLQVVMTKWLENSILFAGFDEVRQNIVALSKIFSLQDPRIKRIVVKGDLVVDEPASTGRIKTRSQARLNPDRYTAVSAELKILKLLVGEVESATNSQHRLGGMPLSAAAGGESGDPESEEEVSDDEWNDVQEAGALDLNSEKVRAEMMGYAEGSSPGLGGGRKDGIVDDEALTYLRGWFREEAGKEGFMGVFALLSTEEKGVLERGVV